MGPGETGAMGFCMGVCGSRWSGDGGSNLSKGGVTNARAGKVARSSCTVRSVPACADGGED